MRSFSSAVDNVDREEGAVVSEGTFGRNREYGPEENYEVPMLITSMDILEALEPAIEGGLLALKADALDGLIGVLVTFALLDVVGFA